MAGLYERVAPLLVLVRDGAWAGDGQVEIEILARDLLGRLPPAGQSLRSVERPMDAGELAEALRELAREDWAARELAGALEKAVQRSQGPVAGGLDRAGLATRVDPSTGSSVSIDGGNFGVVTGRDAVGFTLNPVAARQPEAVAEQPRRRTCILFLAASPEEAVRLRVDREAREVDLALQSAPYRDLFDLRQHLAVRAEDLQECLLRHHPQILHFSGHGSTTSVLLEPGGESSGSVGGMTLARLLAVFEKDLMCVVLNCCHSASQAQMIAAHVRAVVGMSSAIGDSSAIRFSTAFYRALASGADLRRAFELGCLEIDLAGLGEAETPRIICAGGGEDRMKFAP